MVYLKLHTGPGSVWELFEAARLNWSTTYLQLPSDFVAALREKDTETVPGLDWPKFLASKDVECKPQWHISLPHIDHPIEPEDCVKVFHRMDASEEWWTHVFQGPCYVLGENGQTIDRL